MPRNVPPSRKSAPHPITIAVIDGPYDGAGLAGILAHQPISSGDGLCGSTGGAACEHGTFVVGLLGARADLEPPGLCPDCRILHIPLFADGNPSGTTVSHLAAAIAAAVDAGADLINLSLAVIGDDHEFHADLGAALDRAFAADAVVVAAAGNQGREARGQLLSHPATIPVVALDRAGEPLLISNLSPEIARGGVAAPGSDVPGYGPGGAPTRMTGTSAATAVATGILAGVWASRPGITGADIRAAVLQLGPRGKLVPPALDRMQLMAALDQAATEPPDTADDMDRRRHGALHGDIWGKATMETYGGNGMPAPVRPSAVRTTPVTLAGQGGCSCGAPGGKCTCGEPLTEENGFVYAIGTVEAECPNVAIEREMQALAYAWDINPAHTQMRPTEDRHWQYRVLSYDLKQTRYIARQLIWRLTVEDVAALVLTPRDPADYEELIECLNRPKYADHGSGESKGKARGRATKPQHIDQRLVTHPEDRDVIVGVTGPHTTDGIAVTVDQIFTISDKRYSALLGPALFGYLAQLADNFGVTNRDRAYNYLLARYDFEPDRLAEELGQDQPYELAGAPTFVSRLSGGNRVVDVIFRFREPQSSMEKKFFLRVDVTHEFPMIISGMNPYLDR